ncbi:hypothetical protein TNCV_3245621 [Trichonephila clavipes]|nr:hypothetical protein TNCV_3245621 [Trichonephila clavipes]
MPAMIRYLDHWTTSAPTYGRRTVAQRAFDGLRTFESCGQGIGSWPACHEFEPSTTKDQSSRRAMHAKSVESSNVLPLIRRGGASSGVVLVT